MFARAARSGWHRVSASTGSWLATGPAGAFARVVAQLDGEHHPRGDVQLAEDVLQVRVDGPAGDEELLGDLAVGQAGCDQARDLPFPRRELALQPQVAAAGSRVAGP